MPSRIAGTGRFLPGAVLNNEEAAALAGVTPEWIERRSGIRERRVAEPGMGTAKMSTRAALAAIDSASIDPTELDIIVVATSTPDHLTPPTACELQAAIGAEEAACFDVEAGFAGWIYALIVADALLTSGLGRNALVVGADTLSTVTDRSDPDTGPLFGDGAGAIVLSAGESGPLVIRSRTWWADGRLAAALIRPGGGAMRPFDTRMLEDRTHLLRMEGTRLFRQAVRTMADQARRAVEAAGIVLDDIGLVIPHQANLRIIQAVGRELKLPPERVFVNIERYGNTGAATIPIALDDAREQGRLPADSPVLLVSFGAGATAGAVVLGNEVSSKAERQLRNVSARAR